MLPSLPALRRFAVAAVMMLVTMLAIWWSLWMIAAAQYRDFLDNWIATHRAAGYEVTYADRDTEGFPRDISLHFSDFILRNSDGVKIHAHDVSLSTFPWQWHRFHAKLKHGFELAIPFSGSKTLFIISDGLVHNHTELEENGDWKFVDLDVADAKALWGSDPFFSAPTFQIALQRPDTPPKDRKEAGITFSGTAEDLTLPPGLDGPFGPKVAKINVAFRVMGAVPDPRRKDSVATWSNSGGTIEFDKFLLQWGPLALSTRGTLGLDDDLQPEGAFSAQIGNHVQVLKTLMDKDYIPKHETGMLDSALNLFAKRTKVDGAAGIEAPIAVQLGGLFLGPVRVYGFSEIEWGEEPPLPAPLIPDVVAPAPVVPALPPR